MATTRRRKTKKAAAKTTAKRGGKAAARKTVKKLAKPAKKLVATRKDKPARRSKKATRASSEPASKAKTKPHAKLRSSRRGAPGRRHLLTSVRRPRGPAQRGPSQARTVLRRRRLKKPSSGGLRSSNRPIVQIRDFVPADANSVNAIALAAFEQYRGEYEDWPAFSAFVGAMANLAKDGEIIVAVNDDRIVGAVAYFGPRAPKPAIFEATKPVIRMLVVDPAARGTGLGRLLTEECIARARRDGADAIALHSSPIMQVALAMYLRLGFVPVRDSAPIYGVPYCIFLKRL